MDSPFRIQFLDDPKGYFAAIKNAYAMSWSSIARDLQVSVRTVTSWRSREATMPVEIAEKWGKEFDITLPKHAVINLDEERKKAGSLGGKARQMLYGNLGTPDGRRRGGLASCKTHRKNLNSPFVARGVAYPKRSSNLAELVGVILGDGTLTEYQLILYSNIFDESEYSTFLCDLVMDIFGIEPTIIRDQENGVIRIICSRKNLVKYLQSLGLGLGSKVKRQARVPSWVRDNREYANACLRGLIDTDGCVYLDRHCINGIDYASLCIAFTNASMPLLDFVFWSWQSLGFHPTRHGRHVRLRRKEEVMRYAEEVGFSNPKHARKIQV